MTDRTVLLRPEEAARRLSLGRSSIYDLLARGQLRSVKVGRSRRIPVDALDEFVASLATSEK